MKAIALLCLIAVALAANATPKRNIMAVFAQVEETLKNGGPLDIVANVLGEFTNDATAEQAAQDALRARNSHECNGEFEYRARQVSEASNTLKAAQTTLDGCTDQRNRANADLAFSNKVLKETSETLVVLRAAREQEIAAFQEYEEAYNFNSAQMEECIEVVEAVLAGHASMIQVVRHSHKMIKNSMKMNSVEKMSELMAMLVQLSSGETDNEFLEQLSNVVQRLRGNIEDEWNAATAAELKAQEDYDTFVADAAAQEVTLNNTIAELEILLANLKVCIIQETGIVFSATAVRDQHQRLWDEAAAYCGTVENEYVTSTQERRDELDLLDNLRAKVTQRWGDFEDIERERVRKERAKKN